MTFVFIFLYFFLGDAYCQVLYNIDKAHTPLLNNDPAVSSKEPVRKKLPVPDTIPTVANISPTIETFENFAPVTTPPITALPVPADSDDKSDCNICTDYYPEASVNDSANSFLGTTQLSSLMNHACAHDGGNVADCCKFHEPSGQCGVFYFGEYLYPCGPSCIFNGSPTHVSSTPAPTTTWTFDPNDGLLDCSICTDYYPGNPMMDPISAFGTVSDLTNHACAHHDVGNSVANCCKFHEATGICGVFYYGRFIYPCGQSGIVRDGTRHPVSSSPEPTLATTHETSGMPVPPIALDSDDELDCSICTDYYPASYVTDPINTFGKVSDLSNHACAHHHGGSVADCCKCHEESKQCGISVGGQFLYPCGPSCKVNKDLTINAPNTIPPRNETDDTSASKRLHPYPRTLLFIPALVLLRMCYY